MIRPLLPLLSLLSFALVGCGAAATASDQDENALASPSAFDATKTRFSATEVIDLARYRADDATLGAFRAEIDALHAAGTLSQDYAGFATTVERKIDDLDGQSEIGPLSPSSPMRTALTASERVAIYLYTTDELYQRVNGALRSASTTCRSAHPAPCPASAYTSLAPVQATVKVLSSALNKLPPVSARLFRGTTHLEEYQKGAVVTEPTFVSAAHGAVPEAFRGDGVLEFQAKHCASVGEISAAGVQEREAICPPGVTFRVDDRTEEDGVVTVVAEQL